MTKPAERPNVFPWPPVILVSSIVSAALLGLVVPLPWPPSPIRELLSVIGAILIGTALLIDVLTIQALRQARTTFLPHRGAAHLVTSGPFSFSRNPIYLANVLLQFGIGMFFGNPWSFALALIAGGLTQHFAIVREEVHLQAKFPAAWRAYARRVRRWI